jgi:hypothetical protein
MPKVPTATAEPQDDPTAKPATSEPPAQPDNGAAGETPAKPEANPAGVAKWQFFSLGAVLVTLLLVLGLAFWAENNESVIGIIGAVLPSFATIGAAVFGIKAVAETAKAGGEATGRAEGEKGKEAEVKNAKAETAKTVSAALRGGDAQKPFPSRQLFSQIGDIRSALASPSGVDGYQFEQEGRLVDIPHEVFDRALADDDPRVAAALRVANEIIEANAAR